MKRLLLAIAIVLIWAGQGLAVESCTLTSELDNSYSGVPIWKHTWTWVSAADGTASCTGVDMHGRIVKVITDPGAAAPTADYDIVLNEDSADVMGGALTDRHTSSTQIAYPQKGTDAPGDVWVWGSVSAEVTAAGDTKGGEITIYLLP